MVIRDFLISQTLKTHITSRDCFREGLSVWMLFEPGLKRANHNWIAQNLRPTLEYVEHVRRLTVFEGTSCMAGPVR